MQYFIGITTAVLLLLRVSAYNDLGSYPPSSCQIPNQRIPHKSLCGAYYACVYGSYRLKFCVFGNIFNQTQCVKGSCPNVTCPDEDAIVDHPDFCSVYYQCIDWEASVAVCDKGGFDPLSGKCSTDYPCDDRLLISESKDRSLNSDHIPRKKNYKESDSSRDSSESKDSKDNRLFDCPSKNANYSDPYNCNVYFECKKWEATIHLCKRGFAFDSEAKACRYMKQIPNICANKPILESECNGKYSMLLSHPQYCRAYIQCDKKEVRLHQCKRGKGFNPLREKCDKEYDCKNPKGFQCPLKDGKFPHPTCCSLYYICKSGKSKLEICNKNTFFDSDKEDCIKDSQCTEIDQPEFKCPNKSGKYEHPRCDRYYKCQHGLFQLRSCPKGHAFDAYLKECRKNNDCIHGNFIELSTTTTPFTVSFWESTDLDPESTTTASPNTATFWESTPPESSTTDPLQIYVDEFECPTEYGYFVHPLSKKHFITCYNFKPRLGRCSNGLELDQNLIECKSPITVLPTPESTTTDPIQMYVDEFECPNEYGYFVHPLSKKHFINCHDYNSSLNRCREGKEFNPDVGRCMDIN